MTESQQYPRATKTRKGICHQMIQHKEKDVNRKIESRGRMSKMKAQNSSKLRKHKILVSIRPCFVKNFVKAAEQIKA